MIGRRRDHVADYVIVGAGSAGCVLAERLSADDRIEVLLLEQGGSDFGPLIQMPAALSHPMNMKRYDWGYRTEPEPGLDGRCLAAPRGKVLGGSSSINGMVYVRGHRSDFDHWASMGAAGWSFDDVLPHFRAIEAAPYGDPVWRGHDGPLHVTRPAADHALHQAFLAAAEEAGYPLAEDYNGAEQWGFGPLEQTIWRGTRWSAANAWLHPARQRANLILRRGLVTRVLMEGDRAVGVELLRRGRSLRMLARREVILAASAFNSPALLLRSGVGPAAELTDLGITVVADRPGVGRNLQDHLEIYVQQACRQPISLRRHMSLVGQARVGLQWLLTRGGAGASNHFETGGFICSPGADYPDIQFHFLPLAIRYDGQRPAGGDGFQVHVGPMRSKARGSVTLRSSDPLAPPRITFGYLTAADDLADFRHCIGISREIFAQKAFRELAGEELAPGSGARSDAELDAFVRAEAESAYHPCGSCRMGAVDDPESVVDPHCRVIGARGLRVVDSSVFPRITNGNLNAPTLMVAHKAAVSILEGEQP